MTYQQQPSDPNQQYQQPYQQAAYPPPQPGYMPQSRTVTTGGIPGWMHALYAIGTFFTCGLLGIVWVLHWWFAKSKSVTNTTYQQYPPQQGYPPQPPPPPQYPPQQ